MSTPSPRPEASSKGTTQHEDQRRVPRTNSDDQQRRGRSPASRQTQHAQQPPQPPPRASTGPLPNTSIGRPPGVLRKSATTQSSLPPLLPTEKVFPIQIGSEVFRLSGASIASDGMFFSSFFDLALTFRSNLYTLNASGLRILEHPPTSLVSLRNSSGSVMTLARV